jgi:hypothetical protein
VANHLCFLNAAGFAPGRHVTRADRLSVSLTQPSEPASLSCGNRPPSHFNKTGAKSFRKLIWFGSCSEAY